ncbi:hypothetical protein E2C01_012236 [Portunus trituberculatus]|uniref:Uncharacterized protein n=1 Tax=Portunus trituberculatus TaxID=210409 RepID=A0A5B7DD01_PORTR|nr:hypothetical protein [Portunus trituberculatus]
MNVKDSELTSSPTNRKCTQLRHVVPVTHHSLSAVQCPHFAPLHLLGQRDNGLMKHFDYAAHVAVQRGGHKTYCHDGGSE